MHCGRGTAVSHLCGMWEVEEEYRLTEEGQERISVGKVSDTYSHEQLHVSY
jgi:hypothetical protein